jgi:myosin-1
LGNVAFHDNGKGGGDVSYPEVLQLAANYFQVDPALLTKSLCFRVINTGGGGGGGRRSTCVRCRLFHARCVIARACVCRYNVPQNPEQAGGARDALARDIYSKMFEWLVGKVCMVSLRMSHAARTDAVCVRRSTWR